MEKLKPRLKNIYEMYVNKTNTVEESYKQFEDSKVYANELIEKKRKEKENLIKDIREQHKRFIDEALSVRLSQLDPNKKVIDSLDYQTKLSNLINLIALAGGNIEPSNLDFIVEARDSNTLKALSNGNISNELKFYITNNNNIEDIKEQMADRAESLKKAISSNSDDYFTRLVIYETLN